MGPQEVPVDQQSPDHETIMTLYDLDTWTLAILMHPIVARLVCGVDDGTEYFGVRRYATSSSQVMLLPTSPWAEDAH